MRMYTLDIYYRHRFQVLYKYNYEVKTFAYNVQAMCSLVCWNPSHVANKIKYKFDKLKWYKKKCAQCLLCLVLGVMTTTYLNSCLRDPIKVEKRKKL